MTQFQIDIVSDTVCPWCRVGKSRLETAIKEHQAEHPGDVFKTVWHPFYLIPEQKISERTIDIYERKYGALRTRMIHDRLKAVGTQMGVKFDFDGNTGSTRDSHRLLMLAGTKGEEMQTRVVEELFDAYFEQAEDISDREMLVKRGVKAGLDEKEIREWIIESDKGGADVDREVLEAQRNFVFGVPNFTINGEYQIQGAEDPQAFLQIFKMAKGVADTLERSRRGGNSC